MLPDRFWKKVNKNDPEHPGCWVWSASLRNGYARRRGQQAMSTRLAGCVLAAGPFPPVDRRCDWCATPLSGQQRRWCSDRCARAWSDNHWWGAARTAALRRDGHRCVLCGSRQGIEVNHIVPLVGRGYHSGCEHHQDNLETLCHAHHVQVTRIQRRERAGAPGQHVPGIQAPPVVVAIRPHSEAVTADADGPTTEHRQFASDENYRTAADASPDGCGPRARGETVSG